ncbi:hypothetical protein GZ77_08910 [Endozoicomonas montiporae]|uniref:Uncharacterized protein n=2 Tax=Endozoicomonas montiporae TaxID=1027273 RepID=A0A081N7P8_9GAMM|nr:hypothetical protein [Endozoicomonas montiporae]AMO55676.1 hypothetical protein EZMO1_1508 [Endozoicomonas montiporae CL-33]KEQ14471.1 hypothetical protein GZ77_08910 [Endozoicomonas montiporae]
MPKYRKKPVVVEASQWFKNGDHPNDNCQILETGQILTEGHVVRGYRTPDLDAEVDCQYCNNIMEVHGWIDTMEGGHIVCPADWIITGIKGEYYPCKPDIFEQTYELAE